MEKSPINQGIPALAKVDAILDDPRFMAPFLEQSNQRIGRPTVPVETYLRLMFLKFRYQLGYEVLVREVADSIQWRRFCRIPIRGRKLRLDTTVVDADIHYPTDAGLLADGVRLISRTVEKLQTWIERTEQVAEQTAKVQAGELRIPDRLVSMFDPDTRPIRKGKLHKPRTLEERGVKRVSLPQRGKLSAKRKAVQKQFWFRRLQKWRAGGAWRR